MSKTCGHKHVTVPNCDTCRIAELEAENVRLREALEKLARLGNGEHYGNSDGNRIAQAALEADDEC